jgi:hypothetical protein
VQAGDPLWTKYAYRRCAELKKRVRSPVARTLKNLLHDYVFASK